MIDLFQHAQVSITTANGETRSPDPASTLIREDFEGGYVLYLDAVCPEGFAAEDSILLRSDIPDTDDYLSIAALSEYWCAPQWGKSLRELHPRTQELLIRHENGYTCLLPLCADTFKTLLRGGNDGPELVTFTNCDGVTACHRQPSLLCMDGRDPLALLRAIAEKAAELLGGLKMREQRKVSPIFEYLGWCSWDALQIRVSHRGLMEKAAEFKEKQVPIGFAIIDDMWADIPGLNDVPEDIPFRDMVHIMHQSRMNDFAGDPVRFPDGMGAAIADLMAAGIPHVGVWFPTTGYWSGLIPDGPLMQAVGRHTVLNELGQYYVNDWDMWWTDDEQAGKNSLCRAISGGPIYVSDKIGRTRPEVLRPLALRDGRILRCEESAAPTADCLMRDPTTAGHIFKIRNRRGTATLAAVFNIDAENRSVSGTLCAAETGQPADADCLWFEYFSGSCGCLAAGESLSLTLEDNDSYRLYTFLPIDRSSVTVIGRRDLMIGVGAVTDRHYDLESGQTVATLCEGGEILYHTTRPMRVLRGDTELTPVPTAFDGFYTVMTAPEAETLTWIPQ